MNSITQGERLMRIEVLLETAAHEVSEMRAEIRELKKEISEDKAELKELKNRGIGLLIGVGVAGGAIGTAITKALQSVFT